LKTILKKRVLPGVLGSVLFLCTLISSKGFSLLGPFTSWMTPDLGYFPNQGDIGGPMAIGEEYRWNVPVLTYGFDQSFIDYFGQPGIDAVEQAIQVINQLPPASQMALTNYSENPIRYNFQAQEQGLLDLKSTTLSLLLEQLGLTSPTRYIWTLKKWDPAVMRAWRNPNAFLFEGFDELTLEDAGWFIPDYCVKRNYDPFTTQESNYINGTLFSFYVWLSDTNCTKGYINQYAVDPTMPTYTALADNVGGPGSGAISTGLSQDDAGGLRYLYSQTNIHVESLDEFVFPAPGNTNPFIRQAPRPGVDSINFVRHTTNLIGGFSTMTNQFADRYFSNGIIMTQMVQRVTSRPDFLFSARDLGSRLNYYNGHPGGDISILTRNNDTAQWVNNSEINTNHGGAGPGTIRGSVNITFQIPDKYATATGGSVYDPNQGFSAFRWGSFSDTTNVISFSNTQTNLTCLTLSTKVISSNGTPTLECLVLGHQNASYRIESSTNLVDWTSAGSITNTDGIFILHQPLDKPAQYFRTILEE
jgi:hypothetical protein